MTENDNGQPDRIDEIMNLLVGFIDETRQFMAEQKQFNAEQKQFNAKVTEDISRLTREVGQLTDDVGQLKRLTDDVGQLTHDVSQLTDDVGQLKRLTDDVGQLTHDVGQLKRLTDDVGQLKGFHVRAVAMERTASIARGLGLSEFHVLTHEETVTLSSRLSDFDVEENDRLSFAAADLIIEAHGEGRAKHYIAAEISYTVNRDDVRRAVRNVEYLRLLTGSPCHTVVIGCEKTADVDSAIAGGSISWHFINNRAMSPA